MLKEKELSIFCKKLSILSGSGYEINKSLIICSDELNNKNKKIINNVIFEIERGESLSDAFSKTNKFSNYFVSMIKYGEVGGDLENCLNHLHKFYDEEFKTTRKIKESLAYPSLILCMVFLISIFCLVYIVPSYKNFFNGLETDIPIITKNLFLLSDFLIFSHKGLILGSIFFTIFFIFMSRKIDFSLYIDFLKVKIFKDIFMSKSIMKFSNTLSSLTKSGVNVVDAIDLSINILENKFLYNKLFISKQSIKEGDSICKSLDKCSVFPEIVISMIRVGEETGKLENMLDTINSLYRNELESNLEIFIKRIEPTLIIVCGVIVFFFALSIIAPMYDVISLI